nr:hypothetical protein Iba_scaffold13492CG0340 [Ipomoea batatas]
METGVATRHSTNPLSTESTQPSCLTASRRLGVVDRRSVCCSGVGVLVLRTGFLIAIIDDAQPFPFPSVHGSCPEINQILADSLVIIVPTDGGFNRGNLLYLIATVVILGVITRRIVEFHPRDAFLG